jgi:hypothetical protein
MAEGWELSGEENKKNQQGNKGGREEGEVSSTPRGSRGDAGKKLV